MEEFQEGVGNLAKLGSSEVRREGWWGWGQFSIDRLQFGCNWAANAAHHYAYGQVGWAKRRRRMMTMDDDDNKHQDVENEPEWNVPE
jgi:hypothetical protein